MSGGVTRFKCIALQSTAHTTMCTSSMSEYHDLLLQYIANLGGHQDWCPGRVIHVRNIKCASEQARRCMAKANHEILTCWRCTWWCERSIARQCIWNVWQPRTIWETFKMFDTLKHLLNCWHFWTIPDTSETVNTPRTSDTISSSISISSSPASSSSSSP